MHITPTPKDPTEPTDMPTWQRKAEAKRAALRALISTDLRLDHSFENPSNDALGEDVSGRVRASGLLTALETEITDVESVQLSLDKMATGQWKAEEVVRAVMRRALVVQQIVSGLHVALHRSGSYSSDSNSGSSDRSFDSRYAS